MATKPGRQVTIFDSISNPGDIEFLVTPLASLTSTAGSNFGIQAFGFNTQGAGNALTTANIIDPTGWTASVNDNLDGFGSFEIREDTTSSYRQNPLSFRITGIAGDSPSDYAAAGAGGAQGTYYFAAHVAGMTVGPGSAYYGGNVPVSTVVPSPRRRGSSTRPSASSGSPAAGLRATSPASFTRQRRQDPA